MTAIPAAHYNLLMIPTAQTLLLLVTAGLLVACEQALDPLAAVHERGELRFVTRNGPTTYYLDRGGEQGFDYELAAKLAQELGVKLTIRQAFTLDELFSALDRGEADIAGAGLTLTPKRAARYARTVAYASQRPQIIYRVGNRRPRDLADLGEMRIAVIAGSSHEQLLEDLRDERGIDLAWDPVATSDPFDVLRRVADGEADLAVADSRTFEIQQNLLPRLEAAFDLAGERDIVWYLPAGEKRSPLLAATNDFLERQNHDGTLAALRARYFDKDENITRVDTQTFVKRVREGLAEYQQLIEIVAREENLPWELLAAISYQESHWDPLATSRTGVRGMMMLTTATAQELGVEDRTDPAESMRGGARYFRKLRERLPKDIAEPDRTWLALAAYNMGRAHLSDARVLTERRGGDPHLWEDVMETLPLLENPVHYKTLRYGYARGLEAVRYVQNIRHYYNILRWQSARDAAPSPPRDVTEYVAESLRRLRLLAL